jgi:hypothetical protein
MDGCEESRLKSNSMDLLAILLARHDAGSVGWHWGGGTPEHPASIA